MWVVLGDWPRAPDGSQRASDAAVSVRRREGREAYKLQTISICEPYPFSPVAISLPDVLWVPAATETSKRATSIRYSTCLSVITQARRRNSALVSAARVALKCPRQRPSRLRWMCPRMPTGACEGIGISTCGAPSVMAPRLSSTQTRRMWMQMAPAFSLSRAQ